VNQTETQPAVPVTLALLFPGFDPAQAPVVTELKDDQPTQTFALALRREVVVSQRVLNAAMDLMARAYPDIKQGAAIKMLERRLYREPGRDQPAIVPVMWEARENEEGDVFARAKVNVQIEGGTANVEVEPMFYLGDATREDRRIRYLVRKGESWVSNGGAWACFLVQPRNAADLRTGKWWAFALPLLSKSVLDEYNLLNRAVGTPPVAHLENLLESLAPMRMEWKPNFIGDMRQDRDGRNILGFIGTRIVVQAKDSLSPPYKTKGGTAEFQSAVFRFVESTGAVVATCLGRPKEIKLIDDRVEFGQLESRSYTVDAWRVLGKTVLEINPSDLSARKITLLRDLTQPGNPVVEYARDLGLLTKEDDPARYRQALERLIDNAIRIASEEFAAVRSILERALTSVAVEVSVESALAGQSVKETRKRRSGDDAVAAYIQAKTGSFDWGIPMHRALRQWCLDTILKGYEEPEHKKPESSAESATTGT